MLSHKIKVKPSMINMGPKSPKSQRKLRKIRRRLEEKYENNKKVIILFQR